MQQRVVEDINYCWQFTEMKQYSSTWTCSADLFGE